MNQNLAPAIDQLVQEMQSLKDRTSQLGNLRNELENDQNQLNQSQQKRTRILDNIRKLKFDRQNAVQHQDNNLILKLDGELNNLEQRDLPNTDTAISKKESEIRQLQQRGEQLQAQRHQQLINAFQSFDAALNYVVQQPDYFNRYILLIYLRDTIGVQQLDAKEFPSFTDQRAVNEVFGKFEKELSSSEQLLTNQDKKDIDDAPKLQNHISNDEQTVTNMKRALEKENDDVGSLKLKLEKLNAKPGYPPQKLSAFLITALISFAIGLLLIVLGLPSEKNAVEPVEGFLVSGVALIIAGAVLLRLRFINDKQKRLPEIKSKLENAINQFARHTKELQALEQKVSRQKQELAAIFERKPILQTITNSSK